MWNKQRKFYVGNWECALKLCVGPLGSSYAVSQNYRPFQWCWKDRAVIFWTCCAPHRPGTHTEKCTVNNKQTIKHSFRTLTHYRRGFLRSGVVWTYCLMCPDRVPVLLLVCREFRDLGRYKTHYQVYWWWLCVSRHSILLVLLWFLIWEFSKFGSCFWCWWRGAIYFLYLTHYSTKDCQKSCEAISRLSQSWSEYFFASKHTLHMGYIFENRCE